MVRKINLKKRDLIRMYHKELKTQREIAKELGVCVNTIIKYMMIFKIKTRNLFDMKKDPKFNEKIIQKISLKTKEGMKKFKKTDYYKNVWIIEKKENDKKRIGKSWGNHTKETKEIMSLLKKGKSQPLQSKLKKELYRKHPELHPNIILANNGKISKPQKYLYKIVSKIDKLAVLNYPISTEKSCRFADVGIPKLKIDFEYDCDYWHDKKEDKKRDKELIKVGWKTYRFNGNIFSNEFLEDEVQKIIRG